MELSERYIQTLEREGFTSVYEWQDPPDTVYPKQLHEGDFVIVVTDGSVTIDFDGHKKTLFSGQRLDIPAGKSYSFVAGPGGVIYVAGEMKAKIF